MMLKLLTPLSILAVFGFAPLDYFRSEATVRGGHGSEHYAHGKYAESAVDFGAAAKASPGSPELSFNEATARYKAGDYAGAAEAATRALKSINPEKQSSLAERTHYNAGNSWFRQGMYQRAIDAYDHALSIDANDEDALHNKKLAEEALRRQQKEQQQQKPQQDRQQDQEQGQGEDSPPSGQSEQQDTERQSEQGGSSQDDAEQQKQGDDGNAQGQNGQSQGDTADGEDQQAEQQGGPRRSFSNPALPPPQAGKQYPPLDEGDVDQLLKRLQEMERGSLQRMGPRDGRRRMQSPFGMDPFPRDMRDFFNDPFFSDPLQLFDDKEPPKDSGRKDW